MFTLITSLTLLSSLVLAAPHQRHRAGTNQQHDGTSCTPPQYPTVGRAIYFLTNDAENAVVAVPIGKDGMLSKGTVVKTGGAGSNSVDAMGQPAAPDALVGQSALTVVGNVSFLHGFFMKHEIERSWLTSDRAYSQSTPVQTLSPCCPYHPTTQHPSTYSASPSPYPESSPTPSLRPRRTNLFVLGRPVP
jgi:hypothetical protein